MAPTRPQKRWSGRLRTAGALLVLLGTVALVDRVLPGSSNSVGMLPPVAQLALGGAALAVGVTLFALGRKWQ
jgi:hypothetical protein